MQKIFIALFFILAIVTLSHAKVQIGGPLTTEKNWEFIGKFVYQTGVPNMMNFTFKSKNNLKALLYYYSYGSNATGSYFYDNYNAYLRGEIDCKNITGSTVPGGAIDLKSGVPRVFRPSSNVRPYYWFLAVSDCEADHLEIESYQVTYTQTNGTFWEFQFSWDEWGIGPSYIFAMIYYIVLFLLHAFGCYQLYRVEAYHSLIRIYTCSLLMELIANVLLYIHNSSYAVDGIGAPGLEGIGNLLSMGGQVALIFLCILVAKGWAITSSYLTQKYLLLALTGFLVLAYLVLFFWTEFLLSPTVLYVYETIPGVAILIVRAVTVVWFALSLRDTLRVETNPEKRNFYYPFGIFYALWFISMPFTVFVISFFSDWVRMKIVTIAVMVVDAIGYTGFAVLFWPSRAREYFSIRANPLLNQTGADEKL